MGYVGQYLGGYLGAFLGSIVDSVRLPAFDEFTSTLELDMFCFKAGDRLPSISGTITPPEGIDLDDAVLFMTYKGRNTAARTVQVVNMGEVEDVDGTWAWSYDWEEGDTDEPDRYQVGISTEIGGLQMTFPNDDWGEFSIQAQLTDDPVP